MRKAPLEIVDGAYADEDRPYSSQDTVNYLPVFAEQEGTRTAKMLKTPPGLRPYVQVEGSAVRRTWNCEGSLFAVMGQTLYQITNAGIAIPLGTVPGFSRCSMAHNQRQNGNQLVTVNGNSGYCYNNSSLVFERITDEGFPGAIKVVFMDGYIVGIDPARKFAFNSEVGDALSYNTLDRFTSEFLPDRLVTLETTQNQLVLFSEGSLEFFENTGATEQPFRTKRIAQKRGCAGTFASAVVDQTIYWLGDDGIFYRLEGYSPRRISTRPIEQAIRGLNWKSCFAEAWTDAGHVCVYWTFPDGHTWGFDIAAGRWHRRESYGFDRWRPSTLTYINNEWVAGDFQSSRLWKLDWNYILEGSDEIISTRVTQTLADNQNLMLVNRLDLIMDTGQELTVPVDFPGQPEPPTITGDAPSTFRNTPYNYAYTLGSGTPPYRVTLISGSLPPGLLLSTAGVISGTPTDVGMYSFVVRVTDDTGLFDDLPDSISVSLPMILVGQSGVNDVVIQGVGDTIWNGAAVSTGGNIRRFGIGIPGGRYAMHNLQSVTPAAYNDTGGAGAWTATVADVISGGRDAIWLGTNLIIPGRAATNRIHRSTDGATYTTTAGTPIAFLDTVLPGGQTGAGMTATQFAITADAGADGFVDQVAHGLLLSSGGWLGHNATKYVMCGMSGGNFAVKDWSASTGITTPAIPGGVGAGPGVAHAFDGESVEIFASSTNQVLRRVNGGAITLTSQVFSLPVRQFKWSGANFLAIINPVGVGVGQVWTSPDGTDGSWTQSPVTAASALFWFAQEYG